MDARMDARTANDSSHAYGSVPSLDNGDGDAPPRRRCVAAVSLGLACISACVPLANKAVLRHGAKKAALTMTACQLFGVALFFGLVHAIIACKNGAPLRLSEVRRKARNIGPLGVAFGLKLGATNVGLALVSVEMHVLLAATDIVWTALFARLINGERVRNVTGGLALIGCFAGACLVSTDSYDAGRHVAFYAVALNLVGPVIQGIVVTLLRRSATREVARQNTSYVEFTFVKLAFSTLTAGVLALLIEGVADARSCVVALLGDAPRFLTTVGLISGVQLLFTVLATLASGTSVGVVGTVKIIPQWLLAFTMDGASLDPRHVVGVCLVTLSACAWAASGGVSRSPPRLPSRVLFV
jgi:drug/metabolite transporter (DMT)-like permease